MDKISAKPARQTAEQQRQAAVLQRLEEDYGDTRTALEFGSVWQLLVAVILSAQTTDEQVNRITAPLFARYPDAAALAELSAEQLEPLIATCGLYHNKAKSLAATARIIRDDYHGAVPADKQLLTALPGVGGKTANVVLSVGFGQPALAVDTHVQRVSNRLGLACAKTPEQTERQLTALIPRDKWSSAHHWLIWHGRRVCRAQRPLCGECRLAQWCPARAGEEK